jgi:hypothetical protein
VEQERRGFHTTSAETSQKIADRKLNASAAFHLLQVPLVVIPDQLQTLPQESFLIASTRIPNAANQAKDMSTSTAEFN